MKKETSMTTEKDVMSVAKSRIKEIDAQIANHKVFARMFYTIGKRREARENERHCDHLYSEQFALSSALKGYAKSKKMKGKKS